MFIQDKSNEVQIFFALVLSAGYDGDDNEEDAVHHQVPDLFGDQPLQPPDVLMHGMSTPPSTLTIDDSEATYARYMVLSRNSKHYFPL